MQFSAELDRVAARRAGNMVDELHDGVRSLKLRPLETTQAGKEISAKPDARESTRVRTREASVESITAPGRFQIARHGRLVEAVVADACFIHPERAWSPRPASSKHLSASMNDRPPPRLQLGEVFHRSRVISKEVHSADTVLIVEVEVHFANRVVDLDVVGESVGDIDARIIVDREAAAVTCPCGRAASDIPAGLG